MTVAIIGTGQPQAQIKLFYEDENLRMGLVASFGAREPTPVGGSVSRRTVPVSRRAR